MGTRHLFWILIGPSFAVEEGSGTVKMAGDRDVNLWLSGWEVSCNNQGK
jgi:hypothetical protein